jgi:hypothetical protein
MNYFIVFLLFIEDLEKIIVKLIPKNVTNRENSFNIKKIFFNGMFIANYANVLRKLIRDETYMCYITYQNYRY